MDEKEQEPIKIEMSDKLKREGLIIVDEHTIENEDGYFRHQLLFNKMPKTKLVAAIFGKDDTDLGVQKLKHDLGSEGSIFNIKSIVPVVFVKKIVIKPK